LPIFTKFANYQENVLQLEWGDWRRPKNIIKYCKWIVPLVCSKCCAIKITQQSL